MDRRLEPRRYRGCQAGGISLDVKQVWRQTEQILDIAFLPAGMLVLSPSKLTLYSRQEDSWKLRESLPISNTKPWPRDLRGRVRATGPTFQVFLPGLACNGTTDPTLSVDCHASEAPWVLESGARGLLLATFAASRNYFDGRVVTQSGARKTVPPFYSAASVESQGRTLWMMAQTDGKAQIVDASLDPVASIGQWGSDIVGIDARCGGRVAGAGNARRRRERAGCAAIVHDCRSRRGPRYRRGFIARPGDGAVALRPRRRR